MTNKQLLYNKVHALKLELHPSISDDIMKTVDAVFAEHEQEVKDAFDAGRDSTEWNQKAIGFIETFDGDIADLYPYRFKTFEDYKNQKNK